MCNKLIFCACVLTKRCELIVLTLAFHISWACSQFTKSWSVWKNVGIVERQIIGSGDVKYTKLPMSKWSLNWEQLWQSPLAGVCVTTCDRLFSLHFIYRSLMLWGLKSSRMLRCFKDHVSNCLPNDITSQKTWIVDNTTDRTSNLAMCRLLLVPF